MLLLGHMGIGYGFIRFFQKDLPLYWSLLGTVLPDLIDKVLFYFLKDSVSWVSGTRTLGHTGIFLLLLLLVAALTGSRAAWALNLGVFSHLALDVIGDRFELFDKAASARAILFPLLGDFYTNSPESSLVHAQKRLAGTYVFSGEAVGALLLVFFYFRKGKTPTRFQRKVRSQNDT